MNVNLKVKVTYFKRSGKYYTHAEFDAGSWCVINDGTCLSMQCVVTDYWKIIGDTGYAPGLTTNANEFIKVFDAEDGYPILVHPYDVC